jgi:hypothetical protein
MPQTILPKKANYEQPIATDDDHHDALASDPTVSQFPQGSSYGTSTATDFSASYSGASTFGSSPSTGFSSPSFNSSPTTGFNSQPQQPQPNLTTAGSNAAQGADVLVANTNEDWINKKWRPVMGWVYMATCTADFVVFPILWSLLQAMSHGQVTSQWQPLTLQGAGLYHIAMGAVLGIAAYGRTKEKLESKQ